MNVSDEKRFAVVSLKQTGMSIAQIGNAVGLKPRAVTELLKDVNIETAKLAFEPKQKTLRTPIRCGGCGWKITIVPCMGCAAMSRSTRSKKVGHVS